MMINSEEEVDEEVDGDVTEPHTEIVGSPNIYLEEGATLNLTCLVNTTD